MDLEGIKTKTSIATLIASAREDEGDDSMTGARKK